MIKSRAGPSTQSVPHHHHPPAPPPVTASPGGVLHQDQWGPHRGAVLTKWGGQGCHLGKALQTPRGLSNASCPARGSRAHNRGAGLSPRGPKKLREEEFSAEAPALMRRRGRVIPADPAIGQEQATGMIPLSPFFFNLRLNSHNIILTILKCTSHGT